MDRSPYIIMNIEIITSFKLDATTFWVILLYIKIWPYVDELFDFLAEEHRNVYNAENDQIDSE